MVMFLNMMIFSALKSQQVAKRYLLFSNDILLIFLFIQVLKMVYVKWLKDIRAPFVLYPPCPKHCHCYVAKFPMDSRLNFYAVTNPEVFHILYILLYRGLICVSWFFSLLKVLHQLWLQEALSGMLQFSLPMLKHIGKMWKKSILGR